jgi:hypothetical protein
MHGTPKENEIRDFRPGPPRRRASDAYPQHLWVLPFSAVVLLLWLVLARVNGTAALIKTLSTVGAASAAEPIRSGANGARKLREPDRSPLLSPWPGEAWGSSGLQVAVPLPVAPNVQVVDRQVLSRVPRPSSGPTDVANIVGAFISGDKRYVVTPDGLLKPGEMAGRYRIAQISMDAVILTRDRLTYALDLRTRRWIELPIAGE